jgi:hypothetical protein
MVEGRGTGRFKHKFTPIEDFRLTAIVRQYGCRNWDLIAAQMSERNARQCRERWMNYLNPALDQTPFSIPEEHLLDEKLAAFGPRWQFIATFFPGRSPNFIRNHWNAKEKRNADPSVLAQPPPLFFGVFDKFQDDEREIFWENLGFDDI